MATTKPRITVTLTERQHRVLKAMSDYGGQSMSAFIGEVLEQSLPVLERMAESFRRIRAAQDEQKRRIVQELDQAQTEMEPMLDQVIGQFDLFVTRLESAALPEAPPSTPVTNRGVTPPPLPSPKPLRRKASRTSSRKSDSSSSKG